MKRKPPKKANVIPMENLWKLLPHTLAVRASMGRWETAAHLEFLSREYAKTVARGGGRVVVEAPPQHGKSSLTSMWLIIWALETFPNIKIILATYNDDYARYWGQKIKDELEFNPMLRAKPMRGNSSASNFRTVLGGEFLAKGVGGGITGRPADLFVIDDPYATVIDAYSPAYRKMVENWYEAVAETRLSEHGTVIEMATRWHTDDLSNYLEKQKGFKVIKLRAIAKADDPLKRKPGTALWPKKYSIEYLEKVKVSKPRAFWAAMYDQEPTPEGGLVLNPEWFRRWSSLPEKLDEWIISADLNMKEEEGASYEGEKNDFTVYGVWARKGSDIYLVHLVKGVWGITEQRDRFKLVNKQWPRAVKKLVENKANGPALQDMLKKEILGIELVEPEGGKVIRAMACEPMLKAGNVYVPEDEISHPWVKDYLFEIGVFPGGKHDDQVDMTTIALLYFNKAVASWLDAITQD